MLGQVSFTQHCFHLSVFLAAMMYTLWRARIRSLRHTGVRTCPNTTVSKPHSQVKVQAVLEAWIKELEA
jgi:hypothetical protein